MKHQPNSSTRHSMSSARCPIFLQESLLPFGNSVVTNGYSVVIETELLPRTNNYISNSYLPRGNSGIKFQKLFLYVSAAKDAAFYRFYQSYEGNSRSPKRTNNTQLSSCSPPLGTIGESIRYPQVPFPSVIPPAVIHIRPLWGR